MSANFFVFKSLLTTLSNVLPLHLKKTFPPVIWIFTEGEGDGIESRLPFKKISTFPKWPLCCVYGRKVSAKNVELFIWECLFHWLNSTAHSMQCIRYGLFRGKNVCTCLVFTLKLFQNLKLKAFKLMILVDFDQLKKNSGQKMTNTICIMPPAHLSDQIPSERSFTTAHSRATSFGEKNICHTIEQQVL